MCVCMYIYIYIYTYRCSQKEDIYDDMMTVLK